MIEVYLELFRTYLGLPPLTIAIANQKGGVAKNTSTICLGGLLSTEANCLAIDLDPQGNLTTGLGIELPSDQVSCYDLIRVC